MTLPAHDKCLHFMAGTFLFAFFGLFLPGYIAMTIVMLAGIGKELYDRLHPKRHTADVWDALYTIAGGLIGLVCRIGTLI